MLSIDTKHAQAGGALWRDVGIYHVSMSTVYHTVQAGHA